MVAVQTKPMTFAEFERLPDPPEGRFELHAGELVHVPPAKYKHFLMLRKLRKLLDAAAGESGEANTELALLLAERDYRQVDVAFGPHEMWAAPDPEGYFRGAPQLVIEVLSPSNRPKQVEETKRLCLANGCREFWVVDMDRREVSVSTAHGAPERYKSGQRIPLFWGGLLAVDDIFR